MTKHFNAFPFNAQMGNEQISFSHFCSVLLCQQQQEEQQGTISNSKNKANITDQNWFGREEACWSVGWWAVEWRGYIPRG